MNLTSVLDLLGALLLIIAVAWCFVILVPAPWAWPAALAVASFLITGLSALISKGGAR